MSEPLTKEQIEARGLVLGEMVKQEVEITTLRARVAKLEAALNNLRPNVDYHGHKKLDAVLKDALDKIKGELK